MSNYPNPCENCDKPCTHFCEAWRIRYLHRQRQINEYARVNGIVPGAPEYREGVDPCESCARGETCSQICKARAQYWDEQMAKVRKRLGGGRVNTLLNYPGAKWGMAKEIVSLMPPHRSYVEPFFGSGAVLFNKPPSAIETVNDIDGDIVNFFKVLRERPDDLAEAVSLTPYARDVFDDAHKNRGTDPFDRAYRFAIRSKMGHGFKTYQKTGFKIDVYARERSYCVSCWNRLPGDLLEAAERLKGVQIENQPALDVIKKFNHDNVLIYADPPYLLETRGGKQYRHEMTEQDHVELLEALKQHKGAVILSGYPSEMHDRELSGWSRIYRKSYNQNSDQRTEVLWCNFDVPGLFEMEGI